MGFTSHGDYRVRMPSTWPSWLRSLGLGPPHGVGSILSLDSCGAAEPGTPGDPQGTRGFFLEEHVGFHRIS